MDYYKIVSLIKLNRFIVTSNNIKKYNLQLANEGFFKLKYRTENLFFTFLLLNLNKHTYTLG